MRFIAVLFMTALIGIHRAHAAGCISESAKEDLINGFMQRARNSRLSNASVRCLQDYANRFRPIERIINDYSESCYDEKNFGFHMIQAIKPCVHKIGESHKFGEVADVAIKLTEDSMLPSSNMDRGFDGKQLVPSGKKGERRRGKNRFSCKGKPSPRKGPCTCATGCHYCCAFFGKAHSFCLELYCSGGRCCK